MNEIVTTMLGASGVGKTTLLTSIYEEFVNLNQEVNFEFVPDSYTAEILQQNLEELKSMGDEITAKEGAKGIAGTAAVAGPDSLPKFMFDLCKKTQGKKGTELLRLTFRDYPGSYVLSSNPVGREFLKKLLRESAAVIVSIDTPAMIEPLQPDPFNNKNWNLRKDSGKWHQARNHPDEILELFKAAYSRLDEPKLVILAPVKCETYVQTSESALKLLGCIKDKYAPLLKFLGDPSRKDKIAVVTTPIQTVGCLYFSRVYVENFNKPRFVFRKNKSSDTYNPQDNDHLLRYLLSFLLKLHNQAQLYERSPILRTLRNALTFQKIVDHWFSIREPNQGGFIIIYTDGALDDRDTFVNYIEATCRNLNSQNDLKVVIIGFGSDVNRDPSFYLRLDANARGFSDKNSRSCNIVVFDLLNKMPGIIQLLNSQLENPEAGLPEWGREFCPELYG